MIDPDMAAFVADWEQYWDQLPVNADLETRRNWFQSFCREHRGPLHNEINAKQEYLVESANGSVRVREFRRTATLSPVIVFFHGGGWTLGSAETHWEVTARMAAETGAIVLSVDYSLVPEHPYPTAFRQGCAVIEWVIENARTHNFDTDRIALSGDSAGGNLAAVLALWARDHAINIAAQLLIYPVCDFSLDHPSCIQNANGPVLTRSRLADIAQLYCPDPAKRGEPYLAPLNVLRLDGVAPAFIAAAEFDPVRDSAVMYAQALSASGVDAELEPGAGLIHGYLMAINQCSAAEQKFDMMMHWLSEKLTKA